MLSELFQLFRVLVQMGGHDPQLQGFLRLLLVLVALREHGPRTPSAWLDAYDFLHDADRFRNIVVDVGLVSFADQGANLLR